MLVACTCTRYQKDKDAYCTCGHAFYEHVKGGGLCTGEVETGYNPRAQPIKRVKYIKRTLESKHT